MDLFKANQQPTVSDCSHVQSHLPPPREEPDRVGRMSTSPAPNCVSELRVCLERSDGGEEEESGVTCEHRSALQLVLRRVICHKHRRRVILVT